MDLATRIKKIDRLLKKNDPSKTLAFVLKKSKHKDSLSLNPTDKGGIWTLMEGAGGLDQGDLEKVSWGAAKFFLING